jgi:hypothetical protein
MTGGGKLVADTAAFAAQRKRYLSFVRFVVRNLKNLKT